MLLLLLLLLLLIVVVYKEPIISSASICSFKELQVKSVLMDVLVKVVILIVINLSKCLVYSDHLWPAWSYNS